MSSIKPELFVDVEPESEDIDADEYLANLKRTVSRTEMGRILGHRGPFYENIRRKFLTQFDARYLPLDVCLRQFLASFELPGECQQIDRLLRSFSWWYEQHHQRPFCDQETIYGLSYAVLLLQTILHNPMIKEKIGKRDWVKQYHIEFGDVLVEEYLEHLYDQVAQFPFTRDWTVLDLELDDLSSDTWTDPKKQIQSSDSRKAMQRSKWVSHLFVKGKRGECVGGANVVGVGADGGAGGGAGAGGSPTSSPKKSKKFGFKDFLETKRPKSAPVTTSSRQNSHTSDLPSSPSVLKSNAFDDDDRHVIPTSTVSAPYDTSTDHYNNDHKHPTVRRPTVAFQLEDQQPLATPSIRLQNLILPDKATLRAVGNLSYFDSDESEDDERPNWVPFSVTQANHFLSEGISAWSQEDTYGLGGTSGDLPPVSSDVPTWAISTHSTNTNTNSNSNSNSHHPSGGTSTRSNTPRRAKGRKKRKRFNSNAKHPALDIRRKSVAVPVLSQMTRERKGEDMIPMAEVPVRHLTISAKPGEGVRRGSSALNDHPDAGMKRPRSATVGPEPTQPLNDENLKMTTSPSRTPSTVSQDISDCTWGAMPSTAPTRAIMTNVQRCGQVKLSIGNTPCQEWSSWAVLAGSLLLVWTVDSRADNGEISPMLDATRPHPIALKLQKSAKRRIDGYDHLSIQLPNPDLVISTKDALATCTEGDDGLATIFCPLWCSRICRNCEVEGCTTIGALPQNVEQSVGDLIIATVADSFHVKRRKQSQGALFSTLSTILTSGKVGGVSNGFKSKLKAIARWLTRSSKDESSQHMRDSEPAVQRRRSSQSLNKQSQNLYDPMLPCVKTEEKLAISITAMSGEDLEEWVGALNVSGACKSAGIQSKWREEFEALVKRRPSLSLTQPINKPPNRNSATPSGESRNTPRPISMMSPHNRGFIDLEGEETDDYSRRVMASTTPFRQRAVTVGHKAHIEHLHEHPFAFELFQSTRFVLTFPCSGFPDLREAENSVFDEEWWLKTDGAGATLCMVGYDSNVSQCASTVALNSSAGASSAQTRHEDMDAVAKQKVQDYEKELENVKEKLRVLTNEQGQLSQMLGSSTVHAMLAARMTGRPVPPSKQALQTLSRRAQNKAGSMVRRHKALAEEVQTTMLLAAKLETHVQVLREMYRRKGPAE